MLLRQFNFQKAISIPLSNDIKYKFPKFNSDTGEVVFLTKTENGWRIFAVKNKEVLFSIGNKNYGKSKPLCNGEK